MADIKQLLDAEMAKFRAIQEEVQELSIQQQKYTQQANENSMVKDELDILDGNSQVYKLVGPVLLKQNLEDAKANVNKRLEFIANEMEKVNKKIEKKEAEAMEIKQMIMNQQSEMQKAAAQAAKQAIKA